MAEVEINAGYIKLYRKLLDNPIMKKPDLLQLFIYCLLKANHEPERIIFNGQEIVIQRGSFVTGRFALETDLGCKGITLYKRLQKLKNLDFLTLSSNNKFTVVTVVNYELYQSTETESNNKLNNKVTTKEQQSNTNKNDKNDKNDKNNKKNIYIVLFDHWNSKNIIVHKKLTDKIKRKISGALDTYTIDDIKRAIDNYNTVLKGEEYFWSYKWTLEDFLQRGLEKFLTDACFENYKAEKKQPQRNKTAAELREERYKKAQEEAMRILREQGVISDDGEGSEDDN